VICWTELGGIDVEILGYPLTYPPASSMGVAVQESLLTLMETATSSLFDLLQPPWPILERETRRIVSTPKKRDGNSILAGRPSEGLPEERSGRVVLA
jgi:hypothetical protein